MFEAILFYALAATALTGAGGVLLSRDIVRAAVWLLATLGAAAGLYFVLAAPFVAAIQLVVYAGGTLVLIVFGVMLTSRIPALKFTPGRAETLAAALVALLLGAAVTWALLSADWPTAAPAAWPDGPPPAAAGAAGDPQLAVRLTDRHADGTANIGRLLLSDYLVPFEVVSLLLLAVLIGAAYMARPRAPAAAPRAPAREPRDRSDDAEEPAP